MYSNIYKKNREKIINYVNEETPHLHIDFVPYTTRSKRGLDTRISLKQALGFKVLLAVIKRIPANWLREAQPFALFLIG